MPVLGLGLTGFIIPESVKYYLAPKNCNWCSPNSFDSSVRDIFKVGNVRGAAIASDVFAYAILPLSMIVLDLLIHRKKIRQFGVDFLVIAESVLLALGLTQIFKFAVARKRPYSYYQSPATPGLSLSEQNLSFYSGHACLAFSAVFATGTVLTLHRSKYAPIAWGLGIPLALTVAYLRVAADTHYFSDVIVGALVGAFVGGIFPYLLHLIKKRIAR